MNKAQRAMQIAHQIKSQFISFSYALKAAWKIIKSSVVTFVKEEGEVRTATFTEITYVDKVKGFARFIEKLSDNTTQYRSFRFDRLCF